MGVLQRFEHRLEGMVEGAFARAFKSELQPVEIASAVQREMDDRAAIVAQGRTLVPNDFVVELAESDHERLEVYADSLGIELATLAREHAREQGYSFVGPVRMRFEGVPDLTTGTFRIRSGVIRGTTVEDGEIRRPVSDLPHPAGGFAGTPRLLVSGPEPGAGRQHAAHLRAERAADHTRPWHRLRSAPGRSGRVPAPCRAARGGRRGRPRRPWLHQRHVRQRPAGAAGGADRRHARHARPNDTRLPQGRYLLTPDNSTISTSASITASAAGAARQGRLRQPLTSRGQQRHDPMNALTLTLIRIAFLAVLWLFVIAAVGVVRTDLFGTSSVPSRRQARKQRQPRARQPQPAKPAKPARGRSRPLIPATAAGDGGRRWREPASASPISRSPSAARMMPRSS